MRASVLYSGKGPWQWIKRVARDRKLDRQARKRIDDLEKRRAELQMKYAELSRAAKSDEEDERITQDHREEEEPLFDEIERIETDVIRRWAERWNVEIPASFYGASYAMNGLLRSQLAEKIRDERYKWWDPRIKLVLAVVGLLLAIIFNDNIWRWLSPQPAQLNGNATPPSASRGQVNAEPANAETPTANQSPAAPQQPRISQSSKGDNSPNIVAGPNSTVTINPAPNPNAPTITYDFDGSRRETSFNPFVINLVEGTPESKVLPEFHALQDKRDWQGLIKFADQWIEKTPDWLTPSMFKATALIQIGKVEAGAELLRRVERRAGANETYGQARRLLDAMKAQGMIK